MNLDLNDTDAVREVRSHHEAAEKCSMCAIYWGHPSRGGLCSACAPVRRREGESEEFVMLDKADGSGDEEEDRLIMLGATAIGGGLGMIVGGGILAAAGAAAGAFSVTRQGMLGETSRKVSRTVLRAGRSAVMAAGKSFHEMYNYARNSELFEAVQCGAAVVRSKACCWAAGFAGQLGDPSSEDDADDEVGVIKASELYVGTYCTCSRDSVLA